MTQDERLARIKRMEAACDRCDRAVRTLIQAVENYGAVEEDLKALERYYLGPEWMADLDADRAGGIPQDTKRGILTEDAIWDLLTDRHRLMKTLKKMTNQYEKEHDTMNEAMNMLTTRKSCRKFKPEHITRRELELLVEAGLNAPSGMNRQTPRFVAVQDDDTVACLSRLNGAVAGMAFDPFYGAKDVIVVLAKKEGTYLYDGSLAMGNLLNAAWAMGLGSCWIHRAKEVFESGEGKALLTRWGITEEVEGIGFCILGYTAEEKAKTEIKPDRVKYV